MDTDKVIQDLNRRFAAPLPEFYQRRIIFWYDEDKEFVVKMWLNQENRMQKRMLRHAQLGKEFPRCRAVALYISMKKPSLPSKLERGLFT